MKFDHWKWQYQGKWTHGWRVGLIVTRHEGEMSTTTCNLHLGHRTLTYTRSVARGDIRSITAASAKLRQSWSWTTFRMRHPVSFAVTEVKRFWSEFLPPIAREIDA